MKLNISIQKYFAIALIVVGGFLEIMYYAYRFNNDGIDTWIAWILGIFLTLLLSMAVTVCTVKAWGWWLLIVPLIVFSTLSTSAGQTFAMNVALKQETESHAKEQTKQDEIKELTNRISWIDTECQKLQSQIDQSVKNLWQRNYYQSTIEEVKLQQTGLQTERKTKESRLQQIRDEVVTNEKTGQEHSTNIYLFYAHLMNAAPDWLQFVFHTILSVFIAIASPLGIKIVMRPEAKPARKRRKKIQEEFPF